MPSLVDFRKGFGGIIASLAAVTLTISTLITFGSGGTQIGYGSATSTAFYATGTALAYSGIQIRHSGLQAGAGSDGTNFAIGTQSADSLRLYTANVSRWDINSSGNILPSLTDGTLDIGINTARVGTIHAAAVSSSSHIASAGTAANPTYNFAGANEADGGLYSDAAGSIAISADGVRNLVVRSSAVFISPSLQPFSAGAASIGTNTVPFGGIYASTTAASALAAIYATGTVQIANTSSPTTTINMTGRFCIRTLDMIGGTVRYLTIASGSLVITTTDCR